MERSACSIQGMCSYIGKIICILKSGHQYKCFSGDRNVKRSFVIFYSCCVIMFYPNKKILECSIKYNAHRVVACTPLLSTDSGMDSSGDQHAHWPGKHYFQRNSNIAWKDNTACTYRLPKSSLQSTLHNYKCYFFLSHRTHTHTREFTIIPSSVEYHSHNFFVC